MTSTLNCINWMQNQKDQNPCTVAQEVGQLCAVGYTVSSTNFQESNYVPNATTANGCTCSWSVYNLLSACTDCITGQDQFIRWSTWVANCGSYVSNTSYLPSGYTFSQGIPYWAAMSPFTWYDGVFNITQATNIAGEEKPDVTGEPLSTPSTTASTASSISVGVVVGAVIAGIAIIIAGGLFIFWAVRRHRRRRTDTAPTGDPSFNTPGPLVRNLAPVQPTPFGYAHAPTASVTTHLTSPVRSTSSLAATSLTSPVSPVSSNGRTTSPISDAADMITPFLAMSSKRHARRSNTSQLTGKAIEFLSESTTGPASQRARLNPPPYSAEPGPSSGPAPAWERRLSMKKEKKRKGSASVATTYSGHSRSSTKESVTTAHTASRTEQPTASGGRPRAAGQGVGAVQGVEGPVGAAGSVGNIEHGGAEMSGGGADQHLPAV